MAIGGPQWSSVDRLGRPGKTILSSVLRSVHTILYGCVRSRISWFTLIYNDIGRGLPLFKRWSSVETQDLIRPTSDEESRMPETAARPSNGQNFHTPRATARRSHAKAQSALDRLDARYARERAAAIQRIEMWAAEVERIESEMRDGAA